MKRTAFMVLPCLATCALAQQWQLVDSGGPATYAGGLAWDAARNQLIRCGGEMVTGQPHGQTHVFDGARWVRHQASGPMGLLYASSPILMAGDDARGLVLLCNDASTRIWEWDGAVWTQQPSSLLSPPLDSGRTFAFDAVRDRAVLVCQSSSLPAETWEWDHAQWTLSAAATPNLPSCAAFSPTRGRVQLLAGSDLHEWNGTAWTLTVQALVPASSQSDRAMAFDTWRQRLVVVETSASPMVVHELNGITPVSSVTAPGPLPRFGAAMAFDRVRGMAVLCGGTTSTVAEAGKSDTWGFDGQQWTELVQAAPAGAVAMAHDPVRNVLVATGAHVYANPVSSTGTWERDLTGWHRIATPVSPGIGAMVFDSVRNVMLMCEANQIGPRTWNGTSWSAPAATAGPTPRSSFALAFDAVRGETVLFGGRTFSLRDDTWLFNGSTWRQAQPAVAPSARASAMAFDATNGVTVLFGGQTDAGPAADTWLWDGSQWTAASVLVPPPQRSGHAMTFDPVSGRVTMVGGVMTIPVGGGAEVTLRLPADVSSWDGAQWFRVSIAGPRLDQPALAFDVARGRLVLHGGYAADSLTAPPSGDAPAVVSDTLELVTTPASLGEGPAACASGNQARLRGEALPSLGERRFKLQLTGADANGIGAFALGQQRAPGLQLGNGCTLDLGGAITALLVPTNAGGAARLPLPVPNQVALLGTLLVGQAGYLDVTVSFRTTNALFITVGQ